MKRPFLEAPYDWTRTPRTSSGFQAERDYLELKSRADAAVFRACVFVAGVLVGLALSGAL
jgi:hypothetical protein